MSTDPTAPRPPAGAPAGPERSSQIQPLKFDSSSETGASAGFAKMLGPTATPEEVQKAMNQAVNFIIMQLKDEEKKAKETSKHMKDVIEGKDD